MYHISKKIVDGLFSFFIPTPLTLTKKLHDLLLSSTDINVIKNVRDYNLQTATCYRKITHIWASSWELAPHNPSDKFLAVHLKISHSNALEIITDLDMADRALIASLISNPALQEEIALNTANYIATVHLMMIKIIQLLNDAGQQQPLRSTIFSDINEQLQVIAQQEPSTLLASLQAAHDYLTYATSYSEPLSLVSSNIMATWQKNVLSIINVLKVFADKEQHRRLDAANYSMLAS